MPFTEQEFMTNVHRKGVFQRFRYRKADTPKGGKQATVTLERVVTFTGRTGIAWERMAINADREVEDRKWGTRRNVYFIDHTPKTGTWAGTPQVYVTIIPKAGTFRTVYFVDGAEVDRDAYNAHRTESAAKRDGEPLAYLDLNLNSLEWMS